MRLKEVRSRAFCDIPQRGSARYGVPLAGVDAMPREHQGGTSMAQIVQPLPCRKISSPRSRSNGPARGA